MYNNDNVRIRGQFVRITYVYRWYFYRISLVRKWYYIIVSQIVLLILQLTDGTIQTYDHTIGFGEEVAVIWHVNITRSYHISHTVKPKPGSYCISESYVNGITFVYLSIIVRISFEYRVNENVNVTVMPINISTKFV